MHPEQEPRHRKRENFLSLLITVVVGGILFFFLNVVSLGILAHVVGAIFVFGLLGMLHYALWGQTLTQETAGEREEEALRARLESEPWEQ